MPGVQMKFSREVCRPNDHVFAYPDGGHIRPLQPCLCGAVYASRIVLDTRGGTLGQEVTVSAVNQEPVATEPTPMPNDSAELPPPEKTV